MVGVVAYVVFVVPAVFTVAFGFAVLAGALDELDRELIMWPGEAHDAQWSGDVGALGSQHGLTPESRGAAPAGGAAERPLGGTAAVSQ